MPTRVALFRGINVGKAKRIAMADLRSLLVELGYGDVATLLNSGNAIFTARAGTNGAHAARIREAVAKKLGVDAQVVVKSAKEVKAIVAGNPLADIADPARLLVTFVQDDAGLAVVKKLMSQDWGNERLHVGRHAAYLWCADGILESRAAERLFAGLKGLGTTRNWATLNKIHVSLTGNGE